MKVAVLHGPRDLRIEDHPLETDNLGPHDIWVETEITPLKIGTDGGNYAGAERIPGASDFPRRLGDGNVGFVRGVGSEVARFEVGDRAVSRANHQSEYITSEFGPTFKIPDGVDSEDAVFAHLYTLSSLCFRKAQFQPGENVAVVGLGVLGLGAVALGPLLGARVVGLGNSPVRLEMAERMGAHAVYLSDDPDLESKLDEFSDGAGIDLVILTANPWPAYRTSMEVVREDGRVSIVSLPGRGERPLDFNPFAMDRFYMKGISIIAVNARAAHRHPTDPGRMVYDESCERVLSLMSDGGLEPKRVITHRLHYTQMAEAFEMAYRREKSMLGVVFNWRDRGLGVRG